MNNVFKVEAAPQELAGQITRMLLHEGGTRTVTATRGVMNSLWTGDEGGVGTLYLAFHLPSDEIIVTNYLDNRGYKFELVAAIPRVEATAA